MAKKFLSFQEQLNLLSREKKLSYSESDAVKLMKEGYFNVITNYKHPFIIFENNKWYFKDGCSLSQILKFKDFDDSLRILFLEYLVKVEQEVRAIAVYLFESSNNLKNGNWRDTQLYDLDHVPLKKILSLINRLESDIEKNNNDDINEYLIRKKEIPSWAMIQAISYSTFLIFIRFVKQSVRDGLVKIYQIKDENELYSFEMFYNAIDLFRDLRNKCAHNEKIYNYKNDSEIIKDKIMSELNKINSLIPDGCRLINCVIYLKYFLLDEEFEQFINRLKNCFTNLRSVISESIYNDILRQFGINNILCLDKITEYKVKKSFKF